MTLQEAIGSLNSEAQEKIQNCKNVNEVVELLKGNGIEISENDIKTSLDNYRELSDDELDSVTGGIDLSFLFQELIKFTVKKLNFGKDKEQQ